MANQKISLSTVKGLSTGDVYIDMDIQSKAVHQSLTNKNAIRQSIHNILTFVPKDRILYPEFGNRLHDFVFDRIDDAIVENIKNAIKNMIKDEPRVTLEDITVKPNVNENQIAVAVTYTIPSLSTSDSISITINGAIG